MGNLPAKHPKISALVSAMLTGSVIVSTFWVTVFNEPLVPTFLYAIGDLTHLNVFQSPTIPSKFLQHSALVAFAIFIGIVLISYRIAYERFFIKRGIALKFVWGGEESKADDTYSLFGIVQVINTGNVAIAITGFSLEVTVAHETKMFQRPRNKTVVDDLLSGETYQYDMLPMTFTLGANAGVQEGAIAFQDHISGIFRTFGQLPIERTLIVQTTHNSFRFRLLGPRCFYAVIEPTPYKSSIFERGGLG